MTTYHAKVAYTANQSLAITIPADFTGIRLNHGYSVDVNHEKVAESGSDIFIFSLKPDLRSKATFRNSGRNLEFEYRAKYGCDLLPKFNQSTGTVKVNEAGAIEIILRADQLKPFTPRKRKKKDEGDPIAKQAALHAECKEAIRTLNNAMEQWPDLELTLDVEARRLSGQVSLSFE